MSSRQTSTPASRRRGGERSRHRQTVNAAAWLELGLSEDEAIDELIENGWPEETAVEILESARDALEDRSDEALQARIEKRCRRARSFAARFERGATFDDVVDDLIDEGWREDDAEDIALAARLVSEEPGSSERAEGADDAEDLALAPRLVSEEPGSSERDGEDLERSLGRWHWGAFCLSWIWGVANGVNIALLSMIPIFGFFFRFYLGARGLELAWRATESSEDFDRFLEKQRMWSIVGIILFVLSVGLSLLSLFGGGGHHG